MTSHVRLSRSFILLVLGLGVGFAALCYGPYERRYLAQVTPVLGQPFQDMRIMLEGAEIVAVDGLEGFWVRVEEKKLSYNYPRTWAGLGFFGVGPSSLAGWTMFATLSWGISVCFILGLSEFPILWKKWIPVLLIVFLNPAVFLALERANTDLLIFGAVTLFLSLQGIYARSGRRWILLPLFFALVLLKFYPILLLPLVWLVFSGKPLLRASLLVGAVACVALLLPDLIEVAHRTQQVAPASYGVSVPKLYAVGPDTNYAGKLLGDGANLNLVGSVVLSASYALAFAMILLSPLIAGKLFKAWGAPCGVEVDSAIDRFWLGGSLIYTGTFLLGANYDYRLIFLLLTVPWHLKHGGRIAAVHFALLLILMWGWYLPRDFFPARALALAAQWLLFLETVALLVWQLFRSRVKQAS